MAMESASSQKCLTQTDEKRESSRAAGRNR
jgi:hypothetical protein